MTLMMTTMSMTEGFSYEDYDQDGNDDLIL